MSDVDPVEFASYHIIEVKGNGFVKYTVCDDEDKSYGDFATIERAEERMWDLQAQQQEVVVNPSNN